MNQPEYLQARGWKLYRKPWNGWPARWSHPRENKVYYQSEAVRIEKAIELAAAAANPSAGADSEAPAAVDV